MKRIFWLIFAVLTLAAGALLVRFPSERLAGHEPHAPATLPDVRIEHEFVRIPPTDLPAIGSDTGRRAALSAGTSGGPQAKARPENRSVAAAAPSQAPDVQRARRDRTLFEKARRAFVGDGRHRPEPFPRVRDN